MAIRTNLAKSALGLTACTAAPVLALALLAGCASEKSRVAQSAPAPVQNSEVVPSGVAQCGVGQVANAQNPVRPVSAEEPVEPVPTPQGQLPVDERSLHYTDMTVRQAVLTACENSTVIRTLGGRIMTAPETVHTALDPDIKRYHPRYGVEAATSEFDPELRAHLTWQRDHLAENNLFTYPNGIVDESTPTIGYEISKYTEYGGQFYFKHDTFYESTNALNARFGSFWDTRLGFGVRQPLLRGAGREYNLVFGRSENQDLLLSNGISIAQIDATTSRYKLQVSVMKLLSDVEDAYWRLATAYHDLAAKVASRDRAFSDWQRIQELKQKGLKGGEVENEALARADFYATQQEVQDALYGTPTAPGVMEGSRRLNELMGVPPSPYCVIRPVETPPCCKFVFDWQCLYEEAVERRPELCEQRLIVRRREMQLSATRNTLLPQLDLVAEYDLQGYGQDLAGNGAPFASATQTLGEGYNAGTVGLQAVWRKCAAKEPSWTNKSTKSPTNWPRCANRWSGRS
jgi:hypothetical protein